LFLDGRQSWPDNPQSMGTWSRKAAAAAALIALVIVPMLPPEHL
jgi:hypothetical protein